MGARRPRWGAGAQPQAEPRIQAGKGSRGHPGRSAARPRAFA